MSAAVRAGSALAIAATLSACALFDWLSPDPPPDPRWDPIGRVEQRWYVQLPTSDPFELKPNPIWTPHGIVVPSSAGFLVSYDAATGTKRWTAVTRRFAGARPVLGNGVIVVASAYGAVGIDAATGAQKWQFDSPLDERVSALNGQAGDAAYTAAAHLGVDANTAYLPAWGGVVSAIDVASGAPRWIWRDTMQLTLPAGATGAIVSGDTIYVHTWIRQVRGLAPSDLWLVALRSQDGGELWRFQLPEEGYGASPATTPAVFGNLVIVRQAQRIVALDRFTRTVAWTFQEPDTYLADVELALDGGRLYLALNSAADRDGIHIALDALTGAPIWRTVTLNSPNRDVVLSGTRVYSNHEAFITVLDRATGRQLVRTKPPVNPLGCGFLSSTTVGGGGVSVRIGCTSGNNRTGYVYTGFVWSFAEP